MHTNIAPHLDNFFDRVIAHELVAAVEQSSDVSLFLGTAEDYAWEYLEDCVFTKDTPKIFKNYFPSVS
jgi:hypothetical protein